MIIFEIIGIVTTLIIVLLILKAILNELQYKRKNNIKYKFLCKHIYEMDSLWADREVGLICPKCGKKKYINVDTNSFYRFFNN